MKCCKCGSEKVFIRELGTKEWYCLEDAIKAGCPDAIACVAMAQIKSQGDHDKQSSEWGF